MMASVKIYEKRPVFTKRIEEDFSINSVISMPQKEAKVYDNIPVLTKKIEQKLLINTSVSAPSKNVVINSTLPFRIRLTAIRIEAGGASAIPPIPLQIIGYSNYIL